ncbi:hypothetical protein RHSIM_Rhsim06G0134100 [Rhododendron simsii]|uniref:X8 domain-containing protein n=1 Tax=Rhododendron simsii TaxID=118357 RepID=A0A834GVP1_RHOSS|nr:hypothetical protein RHSIM_Rhsim06G0134100 [Rhododendron simsii]
MNNANSSALQAALDWAYGPGGADCESIQQGGPCYDAGDILTMASYAFNDYFLTHGLTDESCNFDGTAALTYLNPSMIFGVLNVMVAANSHQENEEEQHGSHGRPADPPPPTRGPTARTEAVAAATYFTLKNGSFTGPSTTAEIYPANLDISGGSYFSRTWWILTKDGKFFANSAWQALRLALPKVPWAKSVWFPHHVPRWAFIECIAFMGRLSEQVA